MLIEITRPIHAGMAIYPGNPVVSIKQIQKAEAGASALSEMTLGSHTGTQIDAPSHITAGAAGVGDYDLAVMVGACEVVDLSHVESVITAEDLPVTTEERLLIKTKNSDGDVDVFDASFVALDDSAAEELVRRGVKLVGIDGGSIKKKGVKDKVHAILLEALMLTIGGGALGVAGGVTLAYIASFVVEHGFGLSWPFILPWSAVFLGLGMSLIVGVSFGIYPARQAAKKNPIEALRYE